MTLAWGREICGDLGLAESREWLSWSADSWTCPEFPLRELREGR